MVGYSQMGGEGGMCSDAGWGCSSEGGIYGGEGGNMR